MAENPYAPPRSHDFFASKTEQPTRSLWGYWLRAWLGIGVAGVCFGVIGGPIGMIVGGIIAFPMGFFVTSVAFPIASVATYGNLSHRPLLCIGAVSGLISGFTSVLLLSSGRATS